MKISIWFVFNLAVILLCLCFHASTSALPNGGISSLADETDLLSLRIAPAESEGESGTPGTTAPSATTPKKPKGKDGKGKGDKGKKQGKGDKGKKGKGGKGSTTPPP